MAKRGNGEGCIRKRKDGTWEARFTVGRDENKKLIRRSIYGKTRKEVAEKLGDNLSYLKKGIYVDPNSVTCNEWFDDWLTRHLIKTKDSTKQQYEMYLRRLIYNLFGFRIIRIFIFDVTIRN